MAKTPRKFTPYQKGDLVWLEGTNLKTTHPTAKLAPKRHGPFQILEHLSDVTYRLDLPKHWKIHNVFHITLLTHYHETTTYGPTFN